MSTLPRRLPGSLSLLLAIATAGCRDGAAPDPTPPDLRRRIDSLQIVVEHLRGTRFVQSVQGRYVPRSRLLEVYDSVVTETLDPADSAWSELQWAFGFVDTLVPDDRSTDSVDRASIDAFYARGILWVVDDLRGSTEELDLTVAHELVHALQDQRWNLQRTMDEAAGVDRRLALQYLVEGEARLVETMLRERRTDSLLEVLPPLSLDAYRDTLRAGDGLDPEYVTIPAFHPYEQGAHVLARRLSAGGWNAVDRWWRHPPRSSACFLFQGEACFLPSPLPLAPLQIHPPGWRRIHRGCMGPVYASILFSLWSESPGWIPPGALRSEAFLAAGADLPPDSVISGMRSDSFALYADDSGALSLAWRTSWRDGASASRFLESWSRLLVRKQREDRIRRHVPGTLTLAEDRISRVWDRVERFGSEVWVLEGFPGRIPPSFEGGARRPHGLATRP
jgi:hypothetical protein